MDAPSKKERSVGEERRAGVGQKSMGLASSREQEREEVGDSDDGEEEGIAASRCPVVILHRT